MNFLRTIAPIENDELEFDGDDQGLKKRRSNRKPWRAGLAAQTIVANLEDIKSYKLFERSIVSRINPRSIIELELTYRLASLFWRLRRASAIEVELLQLQAEKRPDAKVQPTLRADIPSRVQSPTRLATCGISRSSRSSAQEIKSDGSAAKCFIRIFQQIPHLLDRAAVCETRLWRQAAEVIWMLDALRRPVPPARWIHRTPNFQPARRRETVF